MNDCGFQDTPAVLTPKQACELLSVARHTLWKLTRDHKIKAFRIGNKRRRYLRTEIERFIREGMADGN